MAEIAIYQDIDGTTGFGPQAMREFLSAANGEPVTIRLNSEGGNVIDGLCCYNLLNQYAGRKTVIIDGMALSIASVIAMAGDEIQIAENAWMMVHNPHNEAAGDGDDLREMAGLLDGMRDQLANIYAKKTGKTAAECVEIMAAETWLKGPQAVEYGFADAVTAATTIAANFDSRRFAKSPIKETVSMAASFAELKKAFPRASAEFVVRCLDKSLDLDAARNEYDEAMAKALEEMTEECAKAKAELEEMKESAAKAKAEEEEKQAEAKAKAEEEEKKDAAAKAKARGVAPAKSSASASGGQTATARWNDAVAEKIKAGLPRAKAIRAVVLEQPELQEEVIAEANAD